VDYVYQQNRLRQEEKIETIEEQIAMGNLSQEQASKLMARAKMHQKTDAEARKDQIYEESRLDEAVAAGADYQTTEQMLEELLEMESKYAAVRCFKSFTGIRAIERAARMEQLRRSSPEFVHPFPHAKMMVRSPNFELILGGIMIANGILIGIQTSIPKDSEVFLFWILEHVFTGIFVLEAVLRITVDNWIWLWNLANFCDFSLIMFTGVLPMWILGPLGIESAIVRTAQVLRVLRLVRLIRMVRMLRIFRILWELIQGIMDGGPTLMWTMVVMFVMLYIFAIFAVYMIGKADVFEGDPLAEEYFGDVPKALITLLQIMLLDRWTEIARPLMKKSAVSVIFMFIFNIMVMNMVLLNLVTAVIINNAFARANEDEELRAVQQREANDAEILDLQNIFIEIDKDGSGTLSKEEYDDAVHNNERVMQKLQILQVNPSETAEIWAILDTGSGEIHVDEFAESLRAMQGQAKAKDSFSIVNRLRRVNNRIGKLTARMGQLKTQCEGLRHEAEVARAQLGDVLRELTDFVSLAGVCIPTKALPLNKARAVQLNEMIQDKVERLLDY